MFGWKNKASGLNRRTVEMSGAYDGGLATVRHGLMSGTSVASNLGWRSVDALAVGDDVLTFDQGMQEIVEIRRASAWVDLPMRDTARWPVWVPVGALGNRRELMLLPDQGVLIESEAACDIYGDPFAVIPAQALVGVRGISRAAPAQQIETVSIHFEQEQVIYLEGGTLVHCPTFTSALDHMMDSPAAIYAGLNARTAAFLVEALVVDDHMFAATL